LALVMSAEHDEGSKPSAFIKRKLDVNLENDLVQVDPASSLLTRRDARHRLWLEMQTAYNAYLDACKLVEERPSDRVQSISRGRSNHEIGQRAAFEKYIDARLHFAEFVRDEQFVEAIPLHTVIRDDAPNDQHQLRSLSLRLWAASAVLVLTIALGGLYSV